MKKILSLELLFLGLIAVLGASLRIWKLEDLSYFQDELALLHHQTFSYGWLINFCAKISFHSPLYYFFLKLWTGIFGEGEFISRLSSVIPSVLTCIVPYFYRSILKKSYLYLSIFLTCSFPLIAWSQVVDPYALGVLCFLNAILYLETLQELEGLKRILLCAFFSALCFYIHYSAGLAILIIHLFYVTDTILRSSREMAKKNIYAFMYFILSCLPWIIYSSSAQNMITGKKMTFWSPPLESVTSMKDQLESVMLFLFSGSQQLMFLFVIFIGYEAYHFNRKTFRRPMLYGGSFLVFVLIMAIRSWSYHSVLVERYFIWLVPLLYLIVLTSYKDKIKLMSLLTVYFLGAQFFSPTKMHDHYWQDIRPGFHIMANIAKGTKCQAQPVLISTNKAWFDPYINRFSGLKECHLSHLPPSICRVDDIEDFLKQLPKSSVIGFMESECPVWKKLKLLDPKRGDLISLMGFHVLRYGTFPDT